MLDTGSYVQYHLLLLLSRNPPLSNFRIVSEQGRTKDLKTQNWQLYKSPERASAVSTNIWGDQPSRRSGLGFIMFGSEAWVPVISLCVWKSISCLLSLIPKICLSFSCSSSVQHWESLGLFGLIVHGTACLPIYNMQSFLGFANFYCCFIMDYSQMTLPLMNLCKKATPWNFGKSETTAFQTLKNV